jgi:hypothetical protein
MRYSRICCFQHLSFVPFLANCLYVAILPGLFQWLAALSYILAIGEAWRSAKDASSVNAVEGSGFGGWVEELRVSESVDWEVINGLMRRWLVRREGCRRDHLVYGFGIGYGEEFALSK